MWIRILVVYVTGLGVTAATLLRARMFEKDHLMNAVSLLLWPLYWLVLLVALARNRGR